MDQEYDLRWLMDAVRWLDTVEFQAFLVMLVGAHFGTGDGAGEEIARITSIPRERVLEFERRLRQAGIWSEGRAIMKWYGKDGPNEFRLDLLVATGRISRRWTTEEQDRAMHEQMPY